MTRDKLCNAPGHDTYMHAVLTPTTSRPSPCDANNTSHQQREGEKNHKKGGLNCVFGNFFFYVLDNCPRVQSLK